MEKLNNRMIIIGIDQYADDKWDNLNNAVYDAGRILEVLKARYGFELFNGDDGLYNNNATRENIIDMLLDMGMNSFDDDNVLIFHAGHGREHVTGLGYWVPTEGTLKPSSYISNSDILDSVRASNARHVLLISDSCYAGTMTDPVRGSDADLTPDQLEIKPSRWAFVSGDRQPVSDGAAKNAGSPFGRSLYDFLKNNKKPAITTLEIVEAVQAKVKAQGVHQNVHAAVIPWSKTEWGQMVFRLTEDVISGTVPRGEVENKIVPALSDSPEAVHYIPRAVSELHKEKYTQISLFDDADVKLIDALIQDRHVILVGGAGAGKSSELIHLAHEAFKGGIYYPFYRRPGNLI